MKHFYPKPTLQGGFVVLYYAGKEFKPKEVSDHLTWELACDEADRLNELEEQ